jgi:hypothetical protein
MQYMWIVETPGEIPVAVKTRAQAQELVMLYYGSNYASEPLLFSTFAKKVLFYPAGDDDE